MLSQFSPWKKLLTLGLVTLMIYAVSFSWVENRRRKNGPWEINFTRIDDSPAVIINHGMLKLTNISIVFIGGDASNLEPRTIRFHHGQESPFDLPYGRCVFLDTLFLPGTVVCEMFDHEIQLLPRTLTIDRREHAWQSGEKILLTNRPSATLPTY